MPEAPFPFFLGCGRSGTTMMRLMFDAHPMLAIPTEAYFPIAPDRAWFDEDGRPHIDPIVDAFEQEKWYGLWRLEPGAFRAAAHAAAPKDYTELIRLLYGLYAEAHEKPRYGNKTPKHVYSIPQLSRMFPEGRFVHIVRDGRDVAMSYLDQRFGPSNLAWAAKTWSHRVRLGRQTGSALEEGRYTEVRYEDLLDHPEEELRRLCAFMDLPYDDAMLRYHEIERDWKLNRDPDHHLEKPPTKGLRDWRSQMSRSDVVLFESIAGPELDAFGYARSGHRQSAFDRLGVRARGFVAGTRRRAKVRLRRTASKGSTHA